MALSAEDKNSYSIERAVFAVSGLEAGAGVTLSGLAGSAQAFFLASVFKAERRPLLAVLPTAEAAEGFCSDLKFFLGAEDVSFYPATEVLPFDTQPIHQEILASRTEFLFKLLDVRGPTLMVTSADNLMERVVPREGLAEKALTIRLEEETSREALTGRLVEMGYARVPMVEGRGEMSVRGGIVDIFPPGFEHPLRVEFFGDWIESIRLFDVSTQRSVEEIKEGRILPAGATSLSAPSLSSARERLLERADELGLNAEKWEPVLAKLREAADVAAIGALFPLFYDSLDTIFDYLPEAAIIALLDADSVGGELKGHEREIEASAERLVEKREFFIRPWDRYINSWEVERRLKNYALIRTEPLKGVGLRVESSKNVDLRHGIMHEQPGAHPTLKPLAERIQGWKEEGFRVFLTAHNRAQAERTAELLSGYGISAGIIKGRALMEQTAAGVYIAEGSLASGFRLPLESIVIISEEEVFGPRVKRRAPPARKLEAFVQQIQDLSAGDFIVHRHHGIGRYMGLKRLVVDEVENDFLLIEYREGDKLYLPVSGVGLVTKYHGFEGQSPQLDRLGGTGWTRTKGRVKKAIEKMAGELLKLYAERQVARGFAFSGPTALFREFEAGFEYDETPDQARAIEECLGDMEEPRPMDRLVCGDVGYGKTEVAIRAAFKAALDSKQVAVLVPTTVLAQQHYLTFTKRLSPYPVVVEVLSRFKSRKEQKEVLERLKAGRVDVLIGTHRLLQGDVEFKDLGLIVIDEEHRFGVAQKERLKRMRKTVDVLALTATPIPRTLHMSLASIRDLSIINTPPEDRLAITTSVIRFDEEVIAEAMEREIKRGGQVFFVHNRIHSIPQVEDLLRTIAPGARIATAHGKTREAELERKMLGFVNKDYDVLLSTSIIESGLDIPSANTIIINRADMFGLAELYQLRGRVGRSRHRAYAYFITPEPSAMTDEASKRIEVIQELTEPGSGFRVAAYDLEIRGAGELLGTNQTGHMAEVGFDMYARLLEETTREMRGEKITEEVEPEVRLRVSQFIPEDYIPDTRQRLALYKRLASVATPRELASISDELGDRYGKVPAEVENLIRTTGFKLELKTLGARELCQKGTRLYLSFAEGEVTEPGVIEKAVKMMEAEPARFRITPDSKFIVYMGPGTLPLDESSYVLKELSSGCYIV